MVSSSLFSSKILFSLHYGTLNIWERAAKIQLQQRVSASEAIKSQKKNVLEDYNRAVLDRYLRLYFTQA